MKAWPQGMVDGRRKKGRDRSWDDRKGEKRGRRSKMPNRIQRYLEEKHSHC